MNIKLEYCAPCGYKKRADLAAAALQDQLGISAELIAGKGGVFRVYADDQEIIARSRGYFPSPEEIVAAVGCRVANG